MSLSSAGTAIPVTPRTRPERRSPFVLPALCLGRFMVMVDVTVVNVAAPAMCTGLHGGGPGPVAGGILVDAIGWRAVFWLNVPVVAAAVVAAVLYAAGAVTAWAVGRRVGPA